MSRSTIEIPPDLQNRLISLCEADGNDNWRGLALAMLNLAAEGCKPRSLEITPTTSTSKIYLPKWLYLAIKQDIADRGERKPSVRSTVGYWLAARSMEVSLYAHRLSPDVDRNRRIVAGFGGQRIATKMARFIRIDGKPCLEQKTVGLNICPGSRLRTILPLIRQIGQRQLATSSPSAILSYVAIIYFLAKKIDLPAEVAEWSSRYFSEWEIQYLQKELKDDRLACDFLK